MAVLRAVAQTVRDRSRTTQRGRAARIRGDGQDAGAEPWRRVKAGFR